MSKLEEAVVPSEVLADVQLLLSDPRVKNPFQGLETLYRQEAFFQEHFNYVVCVGKVPY